PRAAANIRRSRSGRMSLLNLLPRFYDPPGARVLLGGVGEVEEADLRRQVPPFAYAPTSTETARPTSSHGSPRGTRRSGRSRSLNVLVVCDRQAASTAKR